MSYGVPMKPSTRRDVSAVVACLWITSAGLVGCASHAPENGLAPDGGPITDESVALAAAQVYPVPAGAAAKVYDVWAVGRDVGSGGIERRETAPVNADNHWTVRSVRVRPDGTEEPPTLTTLTRLEDGSVAVLAVLTPRDTEGAGDIRLYAYDPPLVLLPAELRGQAVFSQTVSMIERDIEDPEKVRGRGEASRVIRLARPGELPEVLGAAEDAVGTVSEMRVSFGPAVDFRRTVSAIGADGIEAERVDRTLRVFGVQLKNDATHFRRQRPDTAVGTAPR